jgi:hypothetical protein
MRWPPTPASVSASSSDSRSPAHSALVRIKRIFFRFGRVTGGSICRPNPMVISPFVTVQLVLAGRFRRSGANGRLYFYPTSDHHTGATPATLDVNCSEYPIDAHACCQARGFYPGLEPAEQSQIADADSRCGRCSWIAVALPEGCNCSAGSRRAFPQVRRLIDAHFSIRPATVMPGQFLPHWTLIAPNIPLMPSHVARPECLAGAGTN